MSQPPSSWDPHAGQQDYPQGPQNPYGSTESFQHQPPSQQAYVPPPQYGGYPPAAYGAPYGQPGYPPPYGGPLGPQRPGAALAAAVLSYVQAGLVLICSFFVLAAGTDIVELLLIGIVQLISVGLLIFGAVQLTSGTGRTMAVIGNGVQLALVVYYLIRISSLDGLDTADFDGAVVIPLFFAVMPAVALGLAFSSAVSKFIAEKQGQAQAQNPQWRS
ncbi:MAG: hypothetical protein WKF47_15445 [Geodermatophilaceae bacterium]|nr:hypothetical protein [Geodermatophilaceae bacterium]